MKLFQTSDEIAKMLMPTIRPRSDWGSDLPVKGTLEIEENVQFFLVHHTASRNDYTKSEVADEIRAFYRFHTGPEKGWPDVAYNFFVDRFGEIWEARQGSIEGPVQGDATGGSQGFAVLCSLIGDYRTAEVSAAQEVSLTQILAWLAERYGVDTTPGAKTTFTSRGSDKWSAGETVTAATISGHRDMSETACPGDIVYNLISTRLPENVSSERQRVAQQLTPTTPAPVEPPQQDPSTPAPDDRRPNLQVASPAATTSETDFPYGRAAIGSGLVASAALGLLGLRTRRQRSAFRSTAAEATSVDDTNSDTVSPKNNNSDL